MVDEGEQMKCCCCSSTEELPEGIQVCHKCESEVKNDSSKN